MRRIRVIPTLLIQNGGLVKSVKFKNHKYVGDPINTVKIFNDKMVDEICILDISASKENYSPKISMIKDIAEEAFMPLAYGGGITSLVEAQELFKVGVEKVIINNNFYKNDKLISQIANQFGSQSVVVSIDVKKNWFGNYEVKRLNGSKKVKQKPWDSAKNAENCGAGEILLTSIDQEGTFSGYDLELINSVSKNVDIPVVANGGASKIQDFKDAVQHGASAVAAGSFFVFQLPHKAVLISYPTQEILEKELYSKI